MIPMRLGKIAPALISTIWLLFSCALVGAQSLTSVTPAIVNASNVAVFTINGTGLLTYDTFSIQKNGGSALPLQIVTQTATAVDCAINLAPQAVGMYRVSATGPGMTPLELQNAFEVTRPNELAISRPTLGTWEFPFSTSSQFMNTQFILLQEDIGRAGGIFALRLFAQPGASNPSGSITVRMKHTSLDQYPSNELDASGWTIVFAGPAPGILAGDVLLIEFDEIFPYNGSDNLAISILNDNSTTALGSSWQTFETGTNRVVAGRSNVASPPSANWSGTTPTARYLRSEVPRLTLEFMYAAPVAAFSAAGTEVVQDVPLSFSDLSVFEPAAGIVRSWDFDEDGIEDSSAASPSFSWSVPGTYTVELIASSGYGQDAETKINHVTVTAASGVDWTLVEME
ncbi:MAG TPA: PKD domain-containing protein [Candidatus Sumerlaeota bacterium]|nr:PKD domain-containing protein [Candidatus Sumerlaeota bacterium]